MPTPFYNRLASYYEYLGGILRAEKKLSAIFPNPADIGWIRESQYSKILTNHLPDGCNILFGGFLFDRVGNESKQTDIIICTDAAPQFKVENKSFAPIDGTIAVIEVKSNLTRDELIKSLEAFNSLPNPSLLEDWQMSALHSTINFDGEPYKIIFAYDGIDKDQITEICNEFYATHPEITTNRMINMIHVCGKSFTYRLVMTADDRKNNEAMGMTGIDEILRSFISQTDPRDILGFSSAFLNIQTITTIQRNILWDFRYMFAELLKVFSRS